MIIKCEAVLCYLWYMCFPILCLEKGFMRNQIVLNPSQFSFAKYVCTMCCLLLMFLINFACTFICRRRQVLEIVFICFPFQYDSVFPVIFILYYHKLEKENLMSKSWSFTESWIEHIYYLWFGSSSVKKYQTWNNELFPESCITLTGLIISWYYSIP